MAERWRPIEGWPYEISDLGRVRRSGAGTSTSVGRILKLETTRNGYMRVQLSRDNCPSRFLVHHLVATAFIGPAPGKVGRGRDDCQINHLSGDKSDNRPSNLEWTTQHKNHLHASEMGLKRHGVQHHNAKLNPARVREARRRYWAGERQRDIAASFGVAKATLASAIHRRTWRHVS